MNKIQLRKISEAINKANSTDRTRKTFTVENGNAVFTPDGFVAYEIPMEIIYKVEDIYGITIPESSGNNLVPDKFKTVSDSNYINTQINTKEFIAELKQYYKEVKKIFSCYTTAGYYIKLNNRVHGYRISLMINVLTILGNDSEIYIDDNRYGNMLVQSNIGKAIIFPISISENVKANKTID